MKKIVSAVLFVAVLAMTGSAMAATRIDNGTTTSYSHFGGHGGYGHGGGHRGGGHGGHGGYGGHGY